MSKLIAHRTNWREVKLGDIADLNMGQSPKSEFYNDRGEGLPFFQGVKDFGEKKPAETMYCSKPAKVVERGDVLISVRAPVGDVNIAEKKSCIGRGVAGIRAKDKNNEFVYYLLLNFKDYIRSYSGGTTYESINKDALRDLEFSVPESPATRQQIADVLSTYDDLIENNAKRIKILEEIAQAIYRELLVPSASKKWKIVTLRDVIESYTGGGWGKEEPDKDYSGPAFVIRGTDIPHATIGNISTCPLRYHKLSNLRARVLRDGDLVFEVSGGSKGQPVGRSLLITTKLLDQFNQKVICASFCKLIRPDKNKISPFQLHEQILSWYGNGVIEKYQVQSTGISNFRFESFIDEEKMALPPEETRKKFDSLLSPLFDEIYSFGSQNQKLRKARDLLLPKLVTGEIEIKT